MKKSYISKITTAIFFFSQFLFANSSAAQSQNALDYDGIDDYVSVPNGSLLIGGAGQFSMTCWVYATNPNPVFPDFDGFCGIRNDADADFYLVQIGASTVEARYRNSAGATFDIVDSGLVLNTWQHYAFVYNGVKTELFRNGALVGSTPATGMILNQGVAFNMGTVYYLGTNYFLTGKTDEVTLWNKALTPFEVNCLYTNAANPADANLRLYYKFNQGTDGGNNTGIAFLDDASMHLTGTFNGFALMGTSSNFVAGIINSTNIADVFCHGETYLFASQLISSGGHYGAVFPSSSGCDSIVELDLTEIIIDTTVSGSGTAVLTANQSGATYQWLNCDSGYTIIAGETNQSFTATVSASYAVIINYNSCIDTSVCALDIAEGISENPFSPAIKIFPNPALNEFTIHSAGGAALKVNDVLGRVVLTVNVCNAEQKTNCSQWESGVYVISVLSAAKNVVMRMVKE
jgi:hypothetical protein